MATSYWNDQLYHQIDQTVSGMTRDLKDFFRGRPVIKLNSLRYQSLVKQVTESYSEGNTFGVSLSAAAHTELPLKTKTQTVWYYGDAINQAIKDAHNCGGGIVDISAADSKNAGGVYYSGAIWLLSNVELRINEGATIKFMRNRTNTYYPVVLTAYEGSDIYNYSPLIYALGQENIAITGKGILDGQEDMWNWRPWKKGYWREPHVENHATDSDYGQNGILSVDNFENHPVSDRIFTDDGHRPKQILTLANQTDPIGHGATTVTPDSQSRVMKTSFRPTFIEPNYCRNVLIEGVTLLNAPFWQVHPLNSENVMINDIRIWDDKTTGYEVAGWNNDDGIDPDSCTNVIIQGSNVYVSDDCVALKAYRNNDGMLRHQPSTNIIIRNSTFSNKTGNSAAISAGSEMSGGIKNVFIENVGFSMAQPLKLKTNAYRGGYIKNVYMRNSTVHNIRFTLVRFQSDYTETLPIDHLDLYNPTVNGIYLDNVHSDTNGESPEGLIEFDSAASRSPISNIFIRNTSFPTTKSVAASFEHCKFVKNLTLEDVKLYNPLTKKTVTYNITPIKLVDNTTAHFANHPALKLTPADPDSDRDILNTLPEPTFRLQGQVDLSSYPDFKDGGQVKVYVNRDKDPVNLQLNPDGSFETDSITLKNGQYWYKDRHYLAVNFYKDDHINTVVYQVTF